MLEGGSCTKNMTSTRGCSYSFVYSWLAMLEGGSCTKNMTSTGGCSCSFVYSWLATLEGGSCTKYMTGTGGCSCSFVCSWLAMLWREVAAQKIWPVPEAVVTVLFTPDWPRWREVAAQKNMTSAGGCSYSFVYSWLATLGGGSCTKIMTSTGGSSCSFVYSWWWVWLAPETCRVNLQNNKWTA